MKKFILPIALGVLLVVSLVFNFIQYGNSKDTNNQLEETQTRLDFFEDEIGSYQTFKQQREEEDRQVQEMERTLNVFVRTSATAGQISALRSLIENHSAIEQIRYISSEESFEEIKARYHDDEGLLDGFVAVGADALPGRLTIKLKDPAQKQALENFIKANDPGSIIESTSSFPY